MSRLSLRVNQGTLGVLRNGLTPRGFKHHHPITILFLSHKGWLNLNTPRGSGSTAKISDLDLEFHPYNLTASASTLCSRLLPRHLRLPHPSQFGLSD